MINGIIKKGAKMELYRKYRPKTLSEIVGNETIVKSLESMSGNFPHAILFTGGSGNGKTTFARVIKNLLECDDYDYNEIDAVDMSGVDAIRDIRKKMMFAPSKGKTRLYLIDECHALTKKKGAGNAQDCLLKALEEAPKHCYFILATTDPQELLPTLKNRCFQYEVETLSVQQIGRDVLLPVCKKEKKMVPKEVLKQIANDCLGSVRAALVILDGIINLPESEMLEASKRKASEESQLIDLCRILMKAYGDPKMFLTVSKIVKGLKQEPETIRRGVLGYFNMVLLNSGKCSAYDIMDCFSKNWYDLGAAGLSMAIFEVCNAE